MPKADRPWREFYKEMPSIGIKRFFRFHMMLEQLARMFRTSFRDAFISALVELVMLNKKVPKLLQEVRVQVAQVAEVGVSVRLVAI